MIGYPLDSAVTYNDSGVPEYDRAISSAPLRKLIKSLFSDGILPNRSTDLMVRYQGTVWYPSEYEGDPNPTVLINPGFGICNGCLKLQEVYYGLGYRHDNYDNPRIDTVVLRLNDNFDVRSCTFDIVYGEQSPNPVAPSLTRNSTVWELGLADIYLPPAWTQEKGTVTDTRLDPNRCGIISSVSEFDTTAFYTQMQDALAGYEIEFSDWFNNIKGVLSSDVAGNLMLQIGALSSLLTANKTNLVSAINEVYSMSIPSVPSRYLYTGSSQSFSGNPIPTSWEPVIEGMKYQNGPYVINASRYETNGEAFKAVDGSETTCWTANLIMGASLDITMVSHMLIDGMFINYTAPSSAVLEIQHSVNGYDWITDKTITNHVSGRTNITLGGNTAKYWRLNFSASGNTEVKVYGWGLFDYTLSELEATYTISNLPTLVDGQIILVKIPPEYDASGVVSNTLNGVTINSILQADRTYELTYHVTHYTAKEV